MAMRAWTTRAIGGAAVLACAGPAGAQATFSLTPVDATYADVSPLQTSLRQQRQTLYQETGFERVFVDPLDPDGFVRIDGAITASFDRSVYAQSRRGGTVAVVPAGTVFSIGPRVTPWEEQAVGQHWSGSRGAAVTLAQPVNGFATQQVSAQLAPRQATEMVSGRPTEDAGERAARPAEATMSSEVYRRQRLQRLRASYAGM